MIYLILSIISSTSLFVIFKILDINKISVLPVIIVNYFTAAVLGAFLIFFSSGFKRFKIQEWGYLALIIGFLFIVVFLIMSASTKKSGIVTTTISTKLSVIVPIGFSLFYDINDQLSTLKIIGIFCAVLTLYFLIGKDKNSKKGYSFTWLPVLLFAGAGLVDSLIKYAQYVYISPGLLLFFTTVLFISSFISGVILGMTRKIHVKQYIQKPILFNGIALGAFNFGSFYFFVQALNSGIFKKDIIDSSIVFGINNIGIVSLSVIIGTLIFKEEFSNIKKLGIGFSLITIFILTLSQYYR